MSTLKMLRLTYSTQFYHTSQGQANLESDGIVSSFKEVGAF
jgi:hypothetical protein